MLAPTISLVLFNFNLSPDRHAIAALLLFQNTVERVSTNFAAAVAVSYLQLIANFEGGWKGSKKKLGGLEVLKASCKEEAQPSFQSFW